jgi:thiol-disulfide isomerase/thioredoxin
MKSRLVVFFSLLCLVAFSQDKLIEGSIIDSETNMPVPFASIGLLGTSRGTSSNLKGQFSLSVPSSFTIRISCLGYETSEVSSASSSDFFVIRLKPSATELNSLVVFSKKVNARKIVSRAFASVDENYNTQPFFQRFFYRHYCKDDSVYGRLIEASVDVWKRKGYKHIASKAGESDEIRVTQLRRSFDKTATARGHVPIAVKSILQADMVGYQPSARSEQLSFFSEVNNLKTDLSNYTFAFEGITNYDGKEVYEISFALREDSVLTTSGYKQLPRNTGTLFITSQDYVFVKFTEQRTWDRDTIQTTSYYTPFNGKYYPYHLIRDGKNYARDGSSHWYHVELMASEILSSSYEKFYGKEPGKFELIKIPYDSVYWNTSTSLKTTPLEDEIIRDLGGGKSLNQQFLNYYQSEKIVLEGAMKGEEGFTWFRNNNKDKQALFIGFWSSKCNACIQEMEQAKRLLKQYKDKIAFVWLSLDTDEVVWRKSIEKFNFEVAGFTNFRIGDASQAATDFQLKAIPYYVLTNKNGDIYKVDAKHPGDVQLRTDFDILLSEKR